MGEIALGDPPRWKRLGNSLCTNLSPPRRTNPSRPYANASLAFLRQNGVHRFPLSTLSRASAFLSSLHLFLSDLLFRPLYTWRVRSHRTTVILHRARVRNFARIFLSLPLFLLLSFPPPPFLFCFFEKQYNVLRGRNEVRRVNEREREIVVTSSRKGEKIRTRRGENETVLEIRRNLVLVYISNDCFILRYA